MGKKSVSPARHKASIAGMGVFWAIFISMSATDSDPLTEAGEEQVKELLAEFEETTEIAREAVAMMDDDVFSNAREGLDSKEKVDAHLAGMSSDYYEMLADERVRTAPAEEMEEKRREAYVEGVITPWTGDEAVVIPWDRDRQVIVEPEGESMMAALAHEYSHFRYGLHGFWYQVESIKEKERSAREWAVLAREHGEVPWILGDLYSILDEWSDGTRTINGELPHVSTLAEFGIDEGESVILAEKCVEKKNERDKELQAEMRESEIASRGVRR